MLPYSSEAIETIQCIFGSKAIKTRLRVELAQRLCANMAMQSVKLRNLDHPAEEFVQ